VTEIASSALVQLLNGLAGASTLFLAAAGLSLIFGVTRIVNFAHGSLCMLGLYVAYSAITGLGGGVLGFWAGILLAALAVAAFGTLVEILLLRPIYRAPELYPLLATFGLALVVKDFALWVWGPDDLLGPRAPGLGGSIDVLGKPFPEYDALLVVIGPAVLGLLWLLLHRTRWGRLVRAATLDRDMVGALGVNQRWLFTSVFALGALLAGLGGALQIPREPAQLHLDLSVLTDAFVVVVIGGMGSLPGAYLAALIVGVAKAACIGIGEVRFLGIELSLSKLTLVIEFLVMAIVLVARPWGLLGKPLATARAALAEDPTYEPASRNRRAAAGALAVVLLLAPLFAGAYGVVLLVDIMVFALFALSLHFLMGPGGMVSFGHAAYFGLGCYGAALLLRKAGLPMEAALLAGPAVGALGAAVFGWFCVRLSGVYLAMLTLAFAQIAWSVVFQWNDFTGGSNGMVGIWPAAWLSSKTTYYYFALALCALGAWTLWRIAHSPFGHALRASRDSPLRAEAIGIDVARIQWVAFVLAGFMAGLAGAVFAFSKGSISPETMSIARSVDGIVMVMLGGVQTPLGPLAGAALLTWLQDTVARNTDYWRAMIGAVILAIVFLFPQGVAGTLQRRFKPIGA
jgi:branched-chain amino acid transport system permease protein